MHKPYVSNPAVHHHPCIGLKHMVSKLIENALLNEYSSVDFHQTFQLEVDQYLEILRILEVADEPSVNCKIQKKVKLSNISIDLNMRLNFP